MVRRHGSPTSPWSLDTMRSMDAALPGSASVAAPGSAVARPPEVAPAEDEGRDEAPSGNGRSARPPETGRAGADGTAPPTRAVPDEEGRPFGTRTVRVFAVATGVILVAGLVLRFWTRSDLWLDEALTVNIAARPLHQLPTLLRRDGAPPLYYVLLHFWMGVFGSSDLAVRSLSGVIGVATVPLAWLAGRRLGGRTVGWAAMLLVATSPFAVRYDDRDADVLAGRVPDGRRASSRSTVRSGDRARGTCSPSAR